MQNNTALMVLVLTMSAILISNSGCGGANPAQSSFGSIAVPTTGICGASIISNDETVIGVVSENACYSGTLEDVADSTTLYKWNCLGANGGKSVACSLELPPASVLPGTSNGLMNDAGYFYVGIDTKAGAIAHVHSTTGFSTPCGISKDSLANEDITCIIEMPEGDIYAKNLEIKYNIPNGDMCRYIQAEPYWFYNNEVGEGPSTIAMSVDQTVNASGDVTAATYICSFDGGAPGACDANDDILATLTPTEQTLLCRYDQTGVNGPNCCMGEKRITKTVTENGALPITTYEKGTWGGSYTDCIGGPGRTNWSKYYPDGTPARLVTFVDSSGVKGTQVVTAPAQLAKPLSGATASIHVASYYGDAADHTHTGFVRTTVSSTAPFFIDPIDDRSGTLIAPAHPSFEFQCLDAAFEVKHRIRAYVREWDTMPDFLTYVSSSGTVVVPDRGNTGEPGTNCVGLGLGGYCNDTWDIDDFLALYLQLPSDSEIDNFPGLGSSTYVMAPLSVRKQYFPRIKYGN